MPIPVTLFSPSPFPLIVSVNGGEPITVPAGTTRSPGTSAATALTWTEGPPEPNAFGRGPNELFVMTTDPRPATLTIDVPRVTWISIQLYILLDGGRSLAAALLNHGTLVSFTRAGSYGSRRGWMQLSEPMGAPTRRSSRHPG
jgi:hypothetical protein